MNPSDQFSRHTITAALPYANGPLHIGHIAGAYLPADTFVRYLRLKGKDVAFISGSDEYGAAIMLRAKKEGISPKEIIDKYHQINKKAFEDFGISFDIYHRTSEQIHAETAQDFFKVLHQKNQFEEIESEQFFDEKAQQFLADRYIIGTCPKCENPNAYGDQCEKCGSTLSPTDLINPKSTLSGNTPILRKTTHWYLPMQKSEEWLKTWISEGKKGIWKTNVYGQCKSWLDQGLQSRAMTRDLEWGIPVPLENAKGKVLYVWLDAPIGYISATREWANQKGKNWEDYWKKSDTRLLHFVGKDNIVFHCIIFPIVLKAYGNGFILPDNVPANEFLNLEGDKISTSRNWAVWLHEYLIDFPNQQDVLRYVLTSIAPENKDSEFTWKDFQARNNNELLAILGNFANRTLVLTNKYYNGIVPKRHQLTDFDAQTLSEMANYPQKIESLLEEFKFKEAQFELMNLARLGNKYLAETEPWKKAKEDPQTVETILNIALQITANLAILMQAFLPSSAEKLQKMLLLDQLSWADAGKTDLISEKHQIGKVDFLFSKIEDEQIEKQIAKLAQSKKANISAEPLKTEIEFDDFAKMDIRVATIIQAEKVAKAKKLLKLTLDTGVDQRTVVSGIAEFYEPNQIIGQQVCLVANLKPKELKGIMSQGMILMAEDVDGKLVFVRPEQMVKNGMTVR
ncbi:MAG: methionine--tRNA ligase, partial [Bacteroidetes bacterium]